MAISLTDPVYGNYVLARAKAAGVETKGRKYLSSLARYPGDPKAWVQDISDVKRVCREGSMSCTGAVEVKGPAYLPEPKEGPNLAEDIIENAILNKLIDNPELRPGFKKRIPEMREQVIEEMAPEH